jgi:hypothetical protein
MIVKIRGGEFDLTEKDRVLFNGKCYIIMTQEVLQNRRWVHPMLPKTTATKLIKEGKMVLCEDKYHFTCHECDKYRFVEDSKKNETNFNDYFKEQMKDPEFREEYNKILQKEEGSKNDDRQVEI